MSSFEELSYIMSGTKKVTSIIIDNEMFRFKEIKMKNQKELKFNNYFLTAMESFICFLEGRREYEKEIPKIAVIQLNDIMYFKKRR